MPQMIPVNVPAIQHVNGPWTVCKHDELVYSGCQVRIWISGELGTFLAVLEHCVDRNREGVVF
jgi:hypothetical protein